MSYSNRHHHNQQQYQHRGALTKLTSSSTSSSFHAIGSTSGVSGGSSSRTGGVRAGAGGVGAGSSGKSVFGGGLNVGRNVPKLVNTSSLRKENGGQDITAVLVNRHGGKKSGCWSTAAVSPVASSTSNTVVSSLSNKSSKLSSVNDGGGRATTPNTAAGKNSTTDSTTTTTTTTTTTPTTNEVTKDNDSNNSQSNSKIKDRNEPGGGNSNDNTNNEGLTGSAPEEALVGTATTNNDPKITSSETASGTANTTTSSNTTMKQTLSESTTRSSMFPTPWNADSSSESSTPSEDNFPPFGQEDNPIKHEDLNQNHQQEEQYHHDNNNNNAHRNAPYNSHGYNDSRSGQPSQHRYNNRQPYINNNNNNHHHSSYDYDQSQNYRHRPYNSNRRHYSNSNSDYHRENSNNYDHEPRRFGALRGESNSNDGSDPMDNRSGNSYHRNHNNSGRSYYSDNSRPFGDRERDSRDNKDYGGSLHDREHNQEPYHYENRHQDFRRPTSYDNHDRPSQHNHHFDNDRGYNSNRRHNSNYHHSSSFGYDRSGHASNSRLLGNRYYDHSQRRDSKYDSQFDRGSRTNRDDYMDGNDGGRSNSSQRRRDENETAEQYRQNEKHDFDHGQNANNDEIDGDVENDVDEQTDVKESIQEDEEEPKVVEPKQILKHDSNENTHKKSNMDAAVDEPIPESKIVNQNVSQTTKYETSDEPSTEDSNNSTPAQTTNEETPTLAEEEGKEDSSINNSKTTIFERSNKASFDDKSRDLLLLQQQQSILRQVEATRSELAKKKLEGERAKQMQQQAKEEEAKNDNNDNEDITQEENKRANKEIDNDEDKIDQQTYNSKDVSSRTKLDEEAIQKSKEEFYAKLAAERKARIEHRQKRKPRTRGVLFKRLPDGTIVNADISEEEIARRAQRQLKKKDSRFNAIADRNGKESDSVDSLPKPPVRQNKRGNSAETSTKEKIEKSSLLQQFIPSPGPSQSAWIAGPPPSMKAPKNVESFENVDNVGVRTSKIDQVLSSGLLDIGNNGATPSWSTNSSQPKVAMGPIMSSWSAFGGAVTVDFDSFGSKPTESNTMSGADLNMDFALPHDLLSNAVESEEEVIVPPENIDKVEGMSTSESKAPGPTNKYHKKPGRPKRFNRKNFTTNADQSNHKRGKNYPYRKPSPKKNRFDNRQKKVEIDEKT